MQKNLDFISVITIKPKLKNTLKEQFKYYVDNQNKLVKKNDGKYIIIKDKQVVGKYDSQAEAYKNATSKYKIGTFIIQYCSSGIENYTQTFPTRTIFK